MTGSARVDATSGDGATQLADAGALLGVAFERSVQAMLLLDETYDLVAVNGAADELLKSAGVGCFGPTLDFGVEPPARQYDAVTAWPQSDDRVACTADFPAKSGGMLRASVLLDRVIAPSGGRFHLMQIGTSRVSQQDDPPLARSPRAPLAAIPQCCSAGSAMSWRTPAAGRTTYSAVWRISRRPHWVVE